MSSFWEGFWYGFTKAFGYALAFYFGTLLCTHPYDTCSEQYTDPTDISECIWILENP